MVKQLLVRVFDIEGRKGCRFTDADSAATNSTFGWGGMGETEAEAVADCLRCFLQDPRAIEYIGRPS